MRVADRIDLSLDLGASFSGSGFGLDHLEGYSITASVTGSPTGTLKLQASNNAFNPGRVDLTENSDAVWVDVTGSSQAVSASGSFMWNTSSAYYRAVRVVWTRSGGSGATNLYYHAKGPQS
jgi:hypothetical protein